MSTVEEVSALKLNVSVLWSLVPALLVIGVLSALNRRVSYKKHVSNGRPGLLVPVNFLGGNENRFSIALAFGATAGSCFEIFLHFASGRGGTGWVKPFAVILTVFVYGVIYYPIFACLTTDHKRLGSCMGLLYSVFRFVIKLLFSVKISVALKASSELGYFSLMDIPVLVCLFCLVIRFLVLTVQSCNRRDIFAYSGTERISHRQLKVADETDITYVKDILQPQRQANGPKPWLIQLRDRIYMPRKGFRYPTQIISTLVVAAIIIYMLAVIVGLIWSASFLPVVASSCDKFKSSDAQQHKRCLSVLRVFRGCGFTSIILSALLSYFLMVDFLSCVRNSILRLYKSRKSFVSGTALSPETLVGKSLQYSGYHIALISWGFVYSLVVIFVVIYFIALFITEEIVRRIVGEVILHFLPIIVFVIFMWITQLLLRKLVFRNRAFPDITITIDNSQVYHIVSFFFFFLNIITGALKGAIRLVKLGLLSFVLMPRIDRTFMIEGMYTWDPGYMSYLGHIYTYTAHRHPVLLVFCHHLVNSSSREELRGPGKAHMYQRAYNRWHLALMLLKNPSLIKERYRSRAQSSVISLKDVDIISPHTSVNIS